jgi:hypothetical protein
MKMWIDKEVILPTRIDCRTEADMLIKALYFKEIKDFGGGIVRPSVMETESPLQKGLFLKKPPYGRFQSRNI